MVHTRFSGATLIHDATLYMRDLLISGTTDPISGTRAADEKWVMTTHPERPVRYPFMTVKTVVFGDQSLGMGTTRRITPLRFEVAIHSKSIKQRDTIWDNVYNTLKLEAKATSGTWFYDLHDFSLDSAVDVDSPGMEGIHSRHGAFTYYYVG